MRRKLFDHIGGKRNTGDIREDWMVAVEGIVVVNEDPEGQHRIKVVIPVIDEAVMFDEWVTALIPWVGPDGYGPVNAPELGSEVVLFGRLAEKHNLFYLARYNEDFRVAAEFADGARGLKTDGDYRIIGEGDLYLRGGRVIIEADASIRITAPGGFFVNGKRIG